GGGGGVKRCWGGGGGGSRLQATLDRVGRLIPRERILVVVSRHHREEVAQQLAGWPAENIIFQPEDRDTTAGILLPLAHVSHRDPIATAAIFPSDHFVLHEERFIEAVRRGVREAQRFPWDLTLLGVQPDCPGDGYGWVMAGAGAPDRETRSVHGVWEKRG